MAETALTCLFTY